MLRITASFVSSCAGTAATDFTVKTRDFPESHILDLLLIFVPQITNISMQMLRQ